MDLGNNNTTGAVMKFAFCNEILGDENLSSENRRAAYTKARNLGYTGVEIAPFTLGQSPITLTAKFRQEFAAEIADHDLKVVGLHWLLAKTDGFHLTTNEASVRAKTADYFRELIQLCYDLGGKIMVLGSPGQRNFSSPMTHEQAAKNAAEVLSKLTDDLAAAGITLALEPLGPAEGNFLNTASQAVDLIEEIGHHNVRLHLDVKAMSSESIPASRIILDNAEYLAHFHANDPNLLGPGMGDFDQGPVFDSLHKIDYSGWVSVEVFDFSLGYAEILARSWSGMAKKFGRTTA